MSTRVAGQGRHQGRLTHTHEGIEQALGMLARRIREVSDECRDKAHMAVGTDYRSPHYGYDRSTFTGSMKWELRRRARSAAIRRSGAARHIHNVRRFQVVRRRRGPGAAIAMAIFRKPLSYISTAFWLLVLLAIILGLVWHALAPVRDAVGRVIPGAYGASDRCATERPAGGIRGAAWEAGNGVREVTAWDPDPEKVKAGLRSGAHAAGLAWGSFQGAIQGIQSKPMEDVPADSFAPVAGCTGPCFVAPAPLPSGTTEGLDEAAAAVIAAGARGTEAVELVAVVMPESQGKRTAANPTSSARGYWQIMTSVHDVTEAQAFDPAYAARFALGLKRESPKGMAGPWAETYGKGLHVPHIPAAKAAVDRAMAAHQAGRGAAQTAPGAAQAAPAASCAPGTGTDALQAGLKGPQGPAGTNGRLDRSKLFPLTWDTRHVLRQDAAQAAEGLNAAYRAAFGQDIEVTDSYRTYEGQVACRKAKGSMCATPGTSNHGWGVALDLGGGIQSFSSSQHAWMVANAPAHGWTLPDWARETGSKPEAWHWEFVGTPGQARAA